MSTGNYDISFPRLLALTPADANLTGYASNVSGAAFTLTATAATDGLAHRVTVRNDTANSKAAINLTLVGTDADGNALTEVLAGPGANATVTSVGYFKTLTSVMPASTFGADTSDIGWAAQIQTQIFNINVLAEDALAVNVDIGGTINYTVQQTFDDLNAASPVWQTLVSAGSQTADGIWNTTGGATGLRVTVNSYSSGATIRINANPTAMVNAPGAGGGGGGGGSDVDLVAVGGTAITLGQKTMAASIPVVIASDQSGIIGVAYSSPLTITRPANQTPYTAGDVVGGALTFPSMGPSAGRIMLTSTQLELDIAAIPTGMTSFFLALYNVTPPSALADNAAWDLPSGDRASFLGIVQLGTPVDLGSTLYVEQNIINKQIKLAGTSLFGYLVTQTGYTPAANSEVYVNTLHAVGLGL